MWDTYHTPTHVTEKDGSALGDMFFSLNLWVKVLRLLNYSESKSIWDYSTM